MENLLLEIITRLKSEEPLDAKRLEAIIRAHSGNPENGGIRYSKKMLLPFYLSVKSNEPERWTRWDITPDLESSLCKLLQMKPRRTASGVATITVLTKPWRCGSNCLYCPNDLRMPKSYLSEEPACQRAERNCFDPYLQVLSRLRALIAMGHVTDKIELIVLGGTWSDYPREYQIWFITQLFKALNDCNEDPMPHSRSDSRNAEDIIDVADETADSLRAFYESCGLATEKETLAAFVENAQQRIAAGSITYNQAMRELYEQSDPWQRIASSQTATLADLEEQQRVNETAKHRVVGLVIETRPDTITPENLQLIRRLGCTKIQMGIQSLDDQILKKNRRGIGPDRIAEAFGLVRLYGFKLHAHFMVNLLGATPEADKKDFLRLVQDDRFLPDEIKLYPCALVAGTDLCRHYEQGSWHPYSENELIDVLSTDVLATPEYARISRMIRDISAGDILAGNKKTNLRQLVEDNLERRLADHPEQNPIREIRYRELNKETPALEDLTLEETSYQTTVSTERFLQWVTAEGKIAGFLRLSLPRQDVVNQCADLLPIGQNEAMIREVHIYGKVAGIGADHQNAQHMGLGRSLIERACDIAREEGYVRLNVISSVGTRDYYRHQFFNDNGLYQQRTL